MAVLFIVDYEIDAALSPQGHIFRAMLSHLGEAEQGKCCLQDARIGRGEFDEFEAVEAHGVVKQVGHFGILWCKKLFDSMRGF